MTTLLNSGDDIYCLKLFAVLVRVLFHFRALSLLQGTGFKASSFRLYIYAGVIRA